MKKIVIISLVALLAFGFASCAKNKKVIKPEAKPAVELVSDKYSKELAKQNNEFAFKLWEALGESKGNELFSPLSINLAMAMAYNGAEGNTKDEILKAMGYNDSKDELNAIFQKNMERLNLLGQSGKVEMELANALFNSDKNKKSIVPEFSETLKEFFFSEMVNLDFGKVKEAAEYINKWVENKTNERIKDIVSERQIAQNQDGLILVNSIYFKSPWQYAFPKHDTTPQRFYPKGVEDDKDYIVTPMMKQTAAYRYGSMGDMEYLEMPFEGKGVSMLFLLPKDMNKLQQPFSAAFWEKMMNSLQDEAEMQVFVPRFRLERSLDDLTKTFTTLGVKDAFSAGRADFSGIMKLSGQKLYISDFVHKAFLEVSEEGAEAAAATQIGFAKTSLDLPKPELKTFRLDKPFFAFIISKPDNNILFMNKVSEPEIFKP